MANEQKRDQQQGQGHDAFDEHLGTVDLRDLPGIGVIAPPRETADLFCLAIHLLLIVKTYPNPQGKHLGRQLIGPASPKAPPAGIIQGCQRSVRCHFRGVCRDRFENDRANKSQS